LADLQRNGSDGIGGRLGAARPGFRGGQEGAGRRGLEWGDRRRSSSPHYATPRNADIQNYIGYGYRRLRQWGPAMQYYQQALLLNRRHRSAHEHLGELYLALGEPARAEQAACDAGRHLPDPCVETDDLKRAITIYNTLVSR